jgi:hypothetical protein
MRILLGLLVGLLIGLSNSASAEGFSAAEFKSANSLWASCGQTSKGLSPVVCVDYVMGVVDADTLLRSYNHFNDGLCVPDSATAGQVTDAVRKYLEQNPKKRDQGAAGVVLTALMDAFPCQAEQDSGS